MRKNSNKFQMNKIKFVHETLNSNNYLRKISLLNDELFGLKTQQFLAKIFVKQK